ncbi:mycofactocin biosynthesis peptidyl-dipeptidase MftE [Arthrobacter sp. FW305-BF8]|uniref:mycofactocin biosynthesis peptidyl-dipeptidase MftE n=1 Tax=Arthrobacter sp. FW305-BF8 TaxID=2879617 RepID=UPI001F01F177|nr:mycofactocin biosynthesis peptidyl-dipeptidase MftE [Arthrobacter sp. FW305-BF8]UKA55227.1 mycofactocin biosynthesis peptidyl-dipeptidase MftE [Arthrobacter sp. FW305-BF8]
MNVSQHELSDLAWPDVSHKPVVLVPVGSTEQHGPHLPLDTDTVVATAVANAVADALARRRPEQVLVAPAVNYGSSGEHQSFAGTASIGSVALRFLIVELVRSLSTWAGRIVLINAHGGNIAALSAAIRQLRTERHDVAWLPCIADGGDLHAGWAETSLMLHLRPNAVRLDRSVAGDTRALADILPALKAGGVGAVSSSGVLGDPADASSADGRRLLELMVQDALHRIAVSSVEDNGMLAVESQYKIPALRKADKQLGAGCIPNALRCRV